jgi:hypothetical protein
VCGVNPVSSPQIEAEREPGATTQLYCLLAGATNGRVVCAPHYLFWLGSAAKDPAQILEQEQTLPQPSFSADRNAVSLGSGALSSRSSTLSTPPQPAAMACQARSGCCKGIKPLT